MGQVRVAPGPHKIGKTMFGSEHPKLNAFAFLMHYISSNIALIIVLALALAFTARKAFGPFNQNQNVWRIVFGCSLPAFFLINEYFALEDYLLYYGLRWLICAIALGLCIWLIIKSNFAKEFVFWFAVLFLVVVNIYVAISIEYDQIGQAPSGFLSPDKPL
jgi:hypothetical protein